MKTQQHHNLENLPFSALPVPNQASTFLVIGKKIQKGNRLHVSSGLTFTLCRWVYTRSIVIDGNFSAEHLKMRRPDEDVALSPGKRYMVEPHKYELHLSMGSETKQVCMCNLQITRANIWLQEIHLL
jgi:hypothetical protein